jgi:hypothetical protein
VLGVRVGFPGGLPVLLPARMGGRVMDIIPYKSDL